MKIISIYERLLEINSDYQRTLNHSHPDLINLIQDIEKCLKDDLKKLHKLEVEGNGK